MSTKQKKTQKNSRPNKDRLTKAEVQAQEESKQVKDRTELTRAERTSTAKKVGIVIVAVILALAMTIPSFAYFIAK